MREKGRNGRAYVCNKTKMYCLGEGKYGDFYAKIPEMTFDCFDDKSMIYITVRYKTENGFVNVYTLPSNGE